MVKKNGFLILIFFLLLSLVSLIQAEELKIQVIITEAKVRLKPDLNSIVISEIPLGAMLKALQKTGEWYHINLPSDDKGFVVSGYIHISSVEEIIDQPVEKPVEKPKPIPVPKKEVPQPPERYVPPPPPPAWRMQYADGITNWRLRNYPEAIEAFEKAIAARKDSSETDNYYPYYYKGLCHFALEKYEEAKYALNTEKNKGEISGEKANDLNQKLEEIEYIILTPPPPPPERKRPPRYKEPAGIKIGVGLRSGYGGSGIMLGGSLNFILMKNLGICIEGLYYSFSLEGSSEFLIDKEPSKGETTIYPIQLSLQGRFPLSPQLTPYITAGAGYYINKFLLDSTIESDWAALGLTIEETIDATFGFHGGAGLDFFLNDSIAINLDARYIILKPKGTWKFTDQISSITTSGEIDPINMNSIMLGLGIKFFF